MKAKKFNKVFFDIQTKLFAYDYECKLFDAVKDAKRKELGLEGFWAWYEKNDKPENPVSSGQSKAYRLWFWNDREELNFDEFVWEHEAHDFIDTLRKAGVETFTVTNQSTALMENMHWFAAEGCTLVGLCEIESTDLWDRDAKKMAVRFAL